MNKVQSPSYIYIYIYIYTQELSDKIEEKKTKLISTFEGTSGYKLILQLPMITRIYITTLSP